MNPEKAMTNKFQESSNRTKIIAALISAAALIIATGIALIPEFLTSESNDQLKETVVPIAIDSRKEWQPTGIIVSIGDSVTVRVVGGKWTGGKDVWPENDGGGLGKPCGEVEIPLYPCPVPDFSLMALVGKIEQGQPFGIGRNKTFLVNDEGMLYLRINDLEGLLEDNAGILAVGVSANK